MTTIKFVRVERDCPANAKFRKEGDTRHIIYDFNVLIDGEHRATMKRTYTGKGYTLADAEGRPLCGPEWRKHIGFEVEKKAYFEATIQDKLSDIPTLAQMAEQREVEAAEALAKRNQRLDDTREYHVKRHGIELYNALAAFRSDPAVKELLAAIDREVADAIANINE